MPSTYVKRIWNDPTTGVGVYVHIVDSTPKRYTVVHSRTTHAGYLPKADAHSRVPLTKAQISETLAACETFAQAAWLSLTSRPAAARARLRGCGRSTSRRECSAFGRS
jgi:hypothetical protein